MSRGRVLSQDIIPLGIVLAFSSGLILSHITFRYYSFVLISRFLVNQKSGILWPPDVTAPSITTDQGSFVEDGRHIFDTEGKKTAIPAVVRLINCPDLLV